jgi:hypothetical protein
MIMKESNTLGWDEAFEKRSLNPIQVERLAQLSEIPKAELEGRSLVELAERLRWLEPEWLGTNRICGKVVKENPTTRVLEPVPFALVRVFDVDWSLLAYFPERWPFGWFFPLGRRLELLATVRTDRCGRFCVRVPRFELDFIRRWFRLRLCLPGPFEPLDLCDIKPWLCEGLREVPDLEFGPGPVIEEWEDRLGPELLGELLGQARLPELARPLDELGELLRLGAGRVELPPPLGEELQRVHEKGGAAELARALKVRLPKTARPGPGLEELSPRRIYGPFRRCIEVRFPVWMPLLDVPDITFRVTQDVDGDGDEELIYSEGLGDVRLNAALPMNVVLRAQAHAISIPPSLCQLPEVPCAEPALVMAGLMPIQNEAAPEPPYLDPSRGTATRVNRPHATGHFAEVVDESVLGRSPLCSTLQLRGCNGWAGARIYRILCRFRAEGELGFGPERPMVGESWQQIRWVGSPPHVERRHVVSDEFGWYQILNPADGWLDPHLLLNWPTTNYANGLYQLRLEFADATRHSLGFSPERRLCVDNRSPVLTPRVAWRPLGHGSFEPVPAGCAVLRRPASHPLEFSVDLVSSCSFLRSVTLASTACGAVRASRTSPLPEHWESPLADDGTLQHFHTHVAETHVSENVRFVLPGLAEPGVYGFRAVSRSRAFNPAGGDGGFGAREWFYDPGSYRFTEWHRQFAVVDA